jgi:serine protease AprX
MIGLLLLAGAFSTLPSQSTSVAINQAVSSYLDEHPIGNVSLVIETTGDPSALEQMVRADGGRIESQYPVLGGFSASVNPALAWRLNHDPRVRRININAPIKLLGSVNYSNLGNRYESLSRIPGAWDAGLDGSEVQVAVVDSGVFPHDDLTKASPNVPGNRGNRVLPMVTNPNALDAYDHYGHGTHVGGIVAGNGYDSNGQFMGVAPNSLLVSVKISDDLGNANEGDVITGLEWIYQANRHGMHIRVVNLSLASTISQSYHASALDAMVEKLWKSGVTVVVAAGNGGGGVNYAPGNDPFVITVGSLEDNYQTTLSGSQMALWANCCTTNDGLNKPDVVADGSHVVSLLSPASQLSVQHPTNMVGGTYFKMGGTSMAAPQVAGMAALMLQKNPQLTNNQVKRILRRNTVPFGGIAYTSWLGTAGGMVDAKAIGPVDGDDNVGVTPSASYDQVANGIVAGGLTWTGADWPGAIWNNTSWTNTSWTSAAWANTSWTNTSWTNGGPAFANTSWTNTSWTNTSWTNTSWTNTSWTSLQWANTSWTNTSWTNTSWTNTSWTNTSWTNTSWTNTSWTSNSWG